MPSKIMFMVALCILESLIDYISPTNALILTFECNFSNERSVLPEDDRIIETFRS
jgi:hypothetical protein